MIKQSWDRTKDEKWSEAKLPRRSGQFCALRKKFIILIIRTLMTERYTQAHNKKYILRLP